MTAGQVIARVETERLAAQLAEARATAAAQQAILQRLRNGTRPEEIAQARANVRASEAEQTNAQQEYDRLAAISSELGGRAVSRQDVENARAALTVAEARLEVGRRALALAEAGPRREEIDQAEAQFRAADARVKFIDQQLRDAELRAPADGVIRSRLMEAGEIASPQRPVYSLAVMDPKWIRAYIAETHLGQIKPGATATISVDSFPGRSYAGWVGFISPVAEFTPKAVQTEELRTSLVYEVRVYVRDPSNQLRLGMPATVTLPPVKPAPATQPAREAYRSEP